MEGYYSRADATEEVLSKGWLDTGDLGFFHQRELYLTGRAKDVLILRGRSHSPTEVEASVDRVAGVRTGCTVAVSWLPDGADGEKMVVLVEAKHGVPRRRYAEIAGLCRDAIRVATGLGADVVEVVQPGTLPRTSSGKLRRQEALRLYRCGELAPPKRMTPVRLAGAVVRSSLELVRLRWNGRG